MFRPAPAVVVSAALLLAVASLPVAPGLADDAGVVTGPVGTPAGAGPSPAASGAVGAGAGLHGNHLSVAPQVIGDGVVVVDSAALLSDGYLALRVIRDGRPGPVVGHVRLRPGVHTGIEVPVAVEELPDGENVTLRATLYGDDGDGEFDPGSDRVLQSFGRPAEEPFAVRRGDGSVRVVATLPRGHRSTGNVTISRVDLPRSGHVVLHRDDDGELGDAVGRTALGAGTSRNVTVPIDPAFFADRGERFDLWAVVYLDGGDGEFDADDDPVTVGRDRVGSLVAVLKTGAPNGSTATTTALVNTPDPTPTVRTPGTSTGSTAGPGASPGTPTDGPRDGGSGGLPLPGFGSAAAALALLAVLSYSRLRRR